MTNHANCFHPKTAAARKVCRDESARREVPARVGVIVIRRAYSDCPDRVLLDNGRPTAAQIEIHYPGAVFEAFGAFAWEGDDYLFDAMTAS